MSFRNCSDCVWAKRGRINICTYTNIVIDLFFRCSSNHLFSFVLPCFAFLSFPFKWHSANRMWPNDFDECKIICIKHWFPFRASARTMAGRFQHFVTLDSQIEHFPSIDPFEVHTNLWTWTLWSLHTYQHIIHFNSLNESELMLATYYCQFFSQFNWL